MGIIRFRQNINYYLKLFDERKENGDLFGALDAVRNGLKYAKTRIDKNSLNILMGQVYFDMQLYTLSCEYYFRALDVGFVRAGAYFGIGRNLVYMQKYILALQYFDKAIEWDNNGMYADAVLEWTRVIHSYTDKHNKQDVLQAIIRDIKKYIKDRQYITALKNIDEILDICPNEEDILLLRVECLQCNGNIDEARTILKMLLKDNPTNTKARLALCKICLFDLDYTSLKTLVSCIDVQSLSKYELLTLSTLYGGIDDYASAKCVLTKLCELVPYSPRVFLYLAICSHNLGQKEDALYYIAQARWLDYENVVLMEFYKLFNSTTEVLPLTDNLPQYVTDKKMQKLSNVLTNQDFVIQWIRSPVLVDDTDWLLTTKYVDIGGEFASAICKYHSKKVKKYVKKSLISTRVNIHQKYLLLREILRSNYYKSIDMTTHLVYRSFYTKMPKLVISVDLFKRSISSARAYIECFANNVNIWPNVKKLCNTILLNKLEYSIDEDTLTCLMFYHDKNVMKGICNYLNVDIGNIENIKTKLNI